MSRQEIDTGIEMAAVAVVTPATVSVITAGVGLVRDRRSSAAGDLALPGDARAVEYRARTLPTDAGEEMALHDARAEDIAERGNLMAAVYGRTRHPCSRDLSASD